jgi:hypothetical protein
VNDKERLADIHRRVVEIDGMLDKLSRLCTLMGAASLGEELARIRTNELAPVQALAQDPDSVTLIHR